jgi:hypothetical protein
MVSSELNGAIDIRSEKWLNDFCFSRKDYEVVSGFSAGTVKFSPLVEPSVGNGSGADVLFINKR